MIFYATFGFSQSLRNHYVKIEAEDASQGWAKMFDAYGNMWAFIYPEEQFETAIARYNLTEVPFGMPNEREYEDE